MLLPKPDFKCGCMSKNCNQANKILLKEKKQIIVNVWNQIRHKSLDKINLNANATKNNCQAELIKATFGTEIKIL